MRDRNVDPPASPRFLADVVSDSLASATEGTDYAEAPPFSDEPGSHYVHRLANELAARGVTFHGGTHQPGEAHDYALTCKTCGQPGTIRVSIDPQEAAGEDYWKRRALEAEQQVRIRDTGEEVAP